jgi:outer membrane protein assembly factor BamE
MIRRHYPPGSALMRPAFLLAAVAAAFSLSACVYRMDIQQGNLLDAEQVDQLEVGMTRSQVRFLLGTPMVVDSFDANRWDYIYSLRQGRSREVTKRQLIVWFDGDKVTRIEEPIPVPRAESTVTG